MLGGGAAQARLHRSQPEAFFDTITVEVGAIPGTHPERRRQRHQSAQIGDDRIGIALDETTTPDTSRRSGARSAAFDLRYSEALSATRACPPTLLRTRAYLTHPIFHIYRSETEMLRYMRRLATAISRSTAP